MKERSLKKYRETHTEFDYITQLHSVHQYFEEPLIDFLQRFIVLMTKAGVLDSRQMAIVCYGSLQAYVRAYLKTKLPTLRETTNDQPNPSK